MIEESYVSFDTAKLLKKAGFEANLKTKYVEEEKDEWTFWDSGPKRSDYNYFDDTIACPTQALAGKWLREVHGIHVFPVYQYLSEKWSYVIQDMAYVNSEKGMKLYTDVFDSCEESLESGLREAIKLIKK